MALRSSVHGKAVRDHSINTDRYRSVSGCSQDLAATVDIGQSVAQDLGRRLPRSIAARRREGKRERV